MNEIWKDICGYEGKYQVSNLGRVKSLYDGHGNYRELIMKGRNEGHGYLKVDLSKNGKYKGIRIHRLVAMAFIPNPNHYEQVDHLDGNKTNNNVANLEWVSPKENTNRAWEKGLAKYTEERKQKLSKIANEKWETNSFRKWRNKKEQFANIQYRLEV